MSTRSLTLESTQILKNHDRFSPSSDFQIVAITETWLKSYILDTEIFSRDCRIFRNDHFTPEEEEGLCLQ